MARAVILAKSAIRAGADLVWPQRSLISHDRHGGSGALSPEEFAALRFITPPVCRRCSLPVEIDLGPETICAACSARPPSWQEARAALEYDAVSRRPILDLKRAGRRDGLKVMGAWMAAAGADLIETAEVCVPVPLHYRRLAARGYNQAAWLAQAACRGRGLPVCVDALKRTRHTPTQGGLSARARRRNMAGAFAVRRSRRARIDGRCVLLVDDVLTTGATLAACSRALLAAGAARVDVLVLARVVRGRDLTI